MTDAPERIQAWADKNPQWGPQWKCCPLPLMPMSAFPITPYIRDDLHAAVVAERDALAARVAELEAERAQILRREEEAWRRANHAEAKVRGWESTLVVRDLPMMSVPVTGWGPGEGEQTTIPQITPERLTDILDRLARAEAARNTGKDD